jgi:tryptophan-rich sensory protein
LLDAQGFAIPINWAIVACCAGAGAGLLWRNRQLKRLAAS